MPRYAWYDPSRNPSPVLGWFDTGQVTYPDLPPANTLLELTDAQWQLRLTGPQNVRDGLLEPGSSSIVIPIPDNQPE